MARLTFSEEDQQQLHKERFEHPHPRVQQRMEVLWLVSQGVVNSEVARLNKIGHATVDRYIAIYRQGGVEGLCQLNWGKSSVSELLQHKESLEESFRQNPPHTTAEACQRIEQETGVKRGLTQVRVFLKRLSV